MCNFQYKNYPYYSTYTNAKYKNDCFLFHKTKTKIM